MIEDELRAAFARHEPRTPAAGPVLAGIEWGYRRRRRQRLTVRLVGAVVAAVAAIAAPALTVGTRPVSSPAPAVPGSPAKAFDALVVGTDGARLGTVLLVHVPAAAGPAYLVSLPVRQLSDAYRQGGFRLVAGTVTGLTGITPSAGALVPFDSLRTAVDGLGGLNLCIDETTVSVDVGFTRDRRQQPPFQVEGSALRPVPGVTPQTYRPGCQHFAGWQVADYVRQWQLLANGDGEAGRQRHLRQVFAALFAALRRDRILADPGRVSQLLDASGTAATVDLGGRSVAQVLTGLGTVTRLVGLAVPVTDPGGRSPDLLHDPVAASLFQAVRDDGVPAWIAAHPGGADPGQ